MKLFYWHNRNNFGDMLAPVILEWVTEREVERVERFEPGKVLSTGSVLGCMREGDVVWGSGWHRNKRETLDVPEGVRFLAVRGPLSRADLKGGDCPEVYGDPALLMPLIVSPDPESERWGGGLWVPHMVDKSPTPESCVASYNITDEWEQVLGAILAADHVVSSSLHAIIVAEAYGIPAAWAPCEGVIGGDFKFRDYLAGTGRDPDLLKPYEFLPPIPDLEGIQRRLIEAAQPLKEMP